MSVVKVANQNNLGIKEVERLKNKPSDPPEVLKYVFLGIKNTLIVLKRILYIQNLDILLYLYLQLLDLSQETKYSLKMATIIQPTEDHLQTLQIFFTVHSFLTFTIFFL